ncbi:hypothetical protein ES703_69494 [subsurface metagenome]
MYLVVVPLASSKSATTSSMKTLSSSVGMIKIFTFESAADISHSAFLVLASLFFSLSYLIPINASPSKAFALITEDISPTPAVKTIASIPPIADV